MPRDLKPQVPIKSEQIFWCSVAQAFCFPPWVAFFILLFHLFELGWHELVLHKPLCTGWVHSLCALQVAIIST